jgi:aspartate/methionine/tyrosine aminotransferase
MNPLFADLPTTIFEMMSSLAREHQAINLGQGFPDDPGPEDVRQKAAEATLSGYNQYPSMMGIPELRNAIASHYGRFHGLTIDPQRETMVTSGATEALTAAILATVKPGDEVVLFQPVYDSYLPMLRLAGGIPKLVTLKPPHWHFTQEDLDAVFSPKTKAVLINTPLNPTGTVLPLPLLEMLAAYCIKFDAICISDEVWEHVVFEGHQHVPLMSIPGMRERTIKVGSAGKMFSLTGWKVGLVVAAPDLLRVVSKAHQFLTFTTPPNLQAAVAYGLMKDAAYFKNMRDTFQKSRDRLTDGLRTLGFDVIPSQGTYFLNIDISSLGATDDFEFCKKLVVEHKVAAIPVSAFYALNPVKNVIRLCFAKNDETLDEGLTRLAHAIGKKSG